MLKLNIEREGDEVLTSPLPHWEGTKRKVK